MSYTSEELAFRAANYELMWAFFCEADKVRGSGRKHYSARTIAEVLRHNSVVRGFGAQFKINNNAIPILARMYMKAGRCPGFFETRRHVEYSVPHKEKQDASAAE